MRCARPVCRVQDPLAVRQTPDTSGKRHLRFTIPSRDAVTEFLMDPKTFVVDGHDVARQSLLPFQRRFLRLIVELDRFESSCIVIRQNNGHRRVLSPDSVHIYSSFCSAGSLFLVICSPHWPISSRLCHCQPPPDHVLVLPTSYVMTHPHPGCRSKTPALYASW